MSADWMELGVMGSVPGDWLSEAFAISVALTTSNRDGRLSASFFVGSSTAEESAGGAGSAKLTLLNGGGSSCNEVMASSYILIIYRK